MPRAAQLRLLVGALALSACSSSYKAENLSVDIVNGGEVDRPEPPQDHDGATCESACPPDHEQDSRA